jgi:hypothetical protein
MAQEILPTRVFMACSTTSMTIDTKAIHIYEILQEKSPQPQQSGTNKPNAVYITLVHCAV